MVFQKKMTEIFLNGFLKHSLKEQLKTRKVVTQNLKMEPKKLINVFEWAKRIPPLGPKGSMVAAKGCSPPHDFEQSHP